MQITKIIPYNIQTRSNSNKRHQILNDSCNSLSHGTQKLPTTAQYLAFTGGYSLDLAKTIERLDILAQKKSNLYPPNIREWAGMILEEGNKNDETLIDIHKRFYSSLKDCFSLKEVKEKFPEFKDVFSDSEVKFTKDSLFESIKKGETDFDASYEGYPNADGKLLTIQNLGNGKALAYARNDAAGTDIDDFSHYYTIIDLSTGERSRLSYQGAEIPYSAGRFAQRSVIVDGKAYIGVNTETANPCVYIYDIASGDVEKGVEIAEGYYFEQIRVMDNE